MALIAVFRSQITIRGEEKRPQSGLLNVCLISPGDTILNLMRIAPMQKINFREYLAVATALVIIVAFFHQWVLTF